MDDEFGYPQNTSIISLLNTTHMASGYSWEYNETGLISRLYLLIYLGIPGIITRTYLNIIHERDHG
jgi:hypothetical protein